MPEAPFLYYHLRRAFFIAIFYMNTEKLIIHQIKIWGPLYSVFCCSLMVFIPFRRFLISCAPVLK